MPEPIKAHTVFRQGFERFHGIEYEFEDGKRIPMLDGRTGEPLDITDEAMRAGRDGMAALVSRIANCHLAKPIN